MEKLCFLAIVLFFAGCGTKKNQTHISSLSEQDSVGLLNLQPSNFVEIDTSGIVLFPLSMTETNNGRDRSYKDIPHSESWNILFYNSKSEKYHLLTEEKILIYNYYLGQSNEYSELRGENSNYIFYTGRSDDFNGDRIISEKDPMYLFVSDRKGLNFRQISPVGYDLLNWKFIKQSNKVILTATADKNQDRFFARDEEKQVFENYLDGKSKPKPVFTKSFIDSLKVNFGKHWHRVNP